MKYCGYCGDQLPDQAEFCPRCGAIQSEAAANDPNYRPPRLGETVPQSSGGEGPKRGLILGVGAVVIAALVGVILFLVLGRGDKTASAPEAPSQAPSAPVISTPAPTQKPTPTPEPSEEPSPEPSEEPAGEAPLPVIAEGIPAGYKRVWLGGVSLLVPEEYSEERKQEDLLELRNMDYPNNIDSISLYWKGSANFDELGNLQGKEFTYHEILDEQVVRAPGIGGYIVAYFHGVRHFASGDQYDAVYHIHDQQRLGYYSITFTSSGDSAAIDAAEKALAYDPGIFLGEEPVEAPPIPASGIAVAATQTVSIGSAPVTLQAYALRDDQGNLSNYVKVRDVAAALDGTASQFDVTWDGAVNLVTGSPYTSRNGQENQTPYSGDRVYTRADAPTKVDGKAVDLSAFLLYDDGGGASTYYKLRDLGQALGFNVGWSADRGIFLEPGVAYDPSN